MGLPCSIANYRPAGLQTFDSISCCSSVPTELVIGQNPRMSWASEVGLAYVSSAHSLFLNQQGALSLSSGRSVRGALLYGYRRNNENQRATGVLHSLARASDFELGARRTLRSEPCLYGTVATLVGTIQFWCSCAQYGFRSQTRTAKTFEESGRSAE